MSDINQMSNLEEDTNMERTWLAEEMESSVEDLVVDVMQHALDLVRHSLQNMTETQSTGSNTAQATEIQLHRTENMLRTFLTRIDDAIDRVSIEVGDDQNLRRNNSVCMLEHQRGHFTYVKPFPDGFLFRRPPPEMAMNRPVALDQDYWIHSATQCQRCISDLRTWDGEPHDYVPRLFTSQKEALDFAKPLLDRISEINDDLEEHSLDTENSRKHNVVPTSELPFLQKAFEALLISGKERVYQLQASERQDNNEEARPETTADVTIFGVNPDTFNLPKLTKSVAEELVDHIYQLDLIAESIQLVEVTNAISARQLSLRNNAEPLQLFHPLPKGSEKECSICRSEEKSEEYVQLDCKARHVFGKECLRVWLLEHNSCPYCREMFDRALYRWPEREVVCPRWLRVLKEVR